LISKILLKLISRSLYKLRFGLLFGLGFWLDEIFYSLKKESTRNKS